MKGKVMTVPGPISPEELGVTMAHEHILIDLTPYWKLMSMSEVSQKARINEPVRLGNLWWIRQNALNIDNLLLTDVKETAKEVMEFKRFGGNAIMDGTNLGLGGTRLPLGHCPKKLVSISSWDQATTFPNSIQPIWMTGLKKTLQHLL